MTRREFYDVVASILSAIALYEGSANHETGRMTHVAMHANVSHDRLKAYLQALAAAGLVSDPAQALTLTQRGHEFLRAYQSWMDALDAFGLRPPQTFRGTPGPESGASDSAPSSRGP